VHRWERNKGDYAPAQSVGLVHSGCHYRNDLLDIQAAANALGVFAGSTGCNADLASSGDCARVRAAVLPTSRSGRWRGCGESNPRGAQRQMLLIRFAGVQEASYSFVAAASPLTHRTG